MIKLIKGQDQENGPFYLSMLTEDVYLNLLEKLVKKVQIFPHILKIGY